MAVNGRAITDAQAHLWKAESPDWPWVPGRKPQLPEPFTIERLLALMDEGGADRVVIVPPSWPGDRNDYALEAAKRYRGDELDAMLLGRDDVERQQPGCRRVDRHRRVHRLQRDAVHQLPHRPAMADRHADLPDLAARQFVVGVVAGLRRQVEGDRQPRLAFREVRAVQLVGLLGRRMARVRAHHPGPVGLWQAVSGGLAHRLVIVLARACIVVGGAGTCPRSE